MLNDISNLQHFWFFTLGALLIGYAVLDGFDLGVGILHLFTKKDEDRRVFMNAIGPVWDGNEVWLVTFGGALFAAFPEAYATVFSAYYIPFMALLCALIFRAVSIEFRSKQDSKAWRVAWDFGFFLGSFTATFLFGVAVGNSIKGIPIGADKEFVGSFFDFLSPYALLLGVFVLSVFTMHGALFLNLKASGTLQERIQRWSWRSFGAFAFLLVLVTVTTLYAYPFVMSNFSKMPLLWVVVGLILIAVANIPRSLYFNNYPLAFLSSCLCIAGMVCMFGMSLYPNLVLSSLDPAWNITIQNAASSEKTLGIMQLVAFIGMPFVLCYTAIIYWVFRGKVEIEELHY
ncbi:MAG: cytochrome d ubiquinol oxidase subunit II [SAR324 cluster bacterium]|uniref:Cytochrome d ubiquinol oxidase subunit II n=1 Tax=SAR324 cluster bacterium TaxID=2024889 RepID=A0A7X9FRE1_9DELT|nr:cytochrome d ubiquinol oxidase subunit II [SAR324 cluster bacterium]